MAGGHTLLLEAQDHFQAEVVGRTMDDAAGECVDKVAKMFGHPMPGGPIVDRFALEADGTAYDFPRPLLNKPGAEFSFSGLKTAMLRFREEHPQAVAEDEPAVLASFFQAVVDVLVQKTFRTLEERKLTRLSVSGGLAASRKLRAAFEAEAERRQVTLYYPPPRLCTDNAAMITCRASYRFAAGLTDDLRLEAFPNML